LEREARAVAALNMMRQTSVLQFDTAGKTVSETVATLEAELVPLEAGSFLSDSFESRKRRLKVIRAGIGSRNLLESSEESSGPAAKVGADSVAFVLGPAGARHMAIATLRDGRIVRRFPFDALSVTSVAVTPDGDRLYYCDRGQVWVIGTRADEGAKPAPETAGDSVAIDGAGKYLYVKRTRAEHRALARIPLAGGQAEVLPIPPAYTISDDPLSSAAVDASGRVLIEVDAANSWYEHVAIIDASRKTFAVVPLGFSGDVWMPGWQSDGRIRYRRAAWLDPVAVQALKQRVEVGSGIMGPRQRCMGVACDARIYSNSVGLRCARTGMCLYCIGRRRPSWIELRVSALAALVLGPDRSRAYRDGDCR
jgi:hypothetical protein